MSPEAQTTTGRAETESDGGSVAGLHQLLQRLEPEQATPVFMHSSWTDKRSESYERLAFLGDSVLGLAVTTHLFPAWTPTATAPAS